MRARKICVFQLRVSQTAAEQGMFIPVTLTKDVMVLKIFSQQNGSHRRRSQLGKWYIAPYHLCFLPPFFP